MFEYFTDKAIAIVMRAQDEARRMGQGFVGTEQILLGLLAEHTSMAAMVLAELGISLDVARSEVNAILGHQAKASFGEIGFTPKAKEIFEQAVQQARQLDSPYVGPEHLLLSLMQDEATVAVKVIERLGANRGDVRRRIIRALGEVTAVASGRFEGRSPQAASASRTRTLDEFGIDLTQKAAAGQLDPVVGREQEIERVVQILGRRRKNNPILIGEPGVGKTAIAEGLAQRIADQSVPDRLQDKRVISLDMGRLMAGTRMRGEFEERLQQILAEVRQSQSILVIDEIHTLVGAGAAEGGIDAANMLKPALARGELQCIGATTLDEYRQHIERDAALERRFQPVKVGEPGLNETIEILYGLRHSYEQHHRLTISDAALMAAAHLSHRYIADRYLPDKAIDLIDEAGSRVRLRHVQQSPARDLKQKLRQVAEEKQAAVQAQDFDRAGYLRDRELELEAQLQQLDVAPLPGTSAMGTPLVSADDIADIVSAWTGVPVTQLTESESARLLHLEDTLHQRVIGQSEAVTAVARAMRRSRVGLGQLDRPIASLFFSGPTGVGKTELTKALAVSVFGSEEAMIRLDMSEYMERHTVSKLIGSPPGYLGYDEGGQLTEAVRRRPYTVILLDEIEKAHPDVFNLLLQVLDDGRLTDAQGRTVSFKHALIVMTSNIGSQVIEKGGQGLGFELAATGDRPAAQYSRIHTLVQNELKQHFRPEFLNRLDEIIVFRQLNRHEISQIAELLLQDVAQRLADQGIGLEVTDAVKQRLQVEGYSPSYGARPLRRAIAYLVEDALADAILSGQVQSGQTAIVDLDAAGQVAVKIAAVQQPLLVGAR